METFNEIFLSHGFKIKKKFYGYSSYYNKDLKAWAYVDSIAKTIELNDINLKFSITDLISALSKLS